MASGKRAAIGSAAKKLSDASKDVKDAGLKKKGGDLGKKLSGSAGALSSKVLSAENLKNIAIIGIALLVVFLGWYSLHGW